MDTKTYYLEHREKYEAYYQKHKEELRVYWQLRRAKNRELNASGGIKDNRQVKKCTICKRYLPLSSFHHNRTTWDGLVHYCKECNVIKSRQWREKNKKRMNEIVYHSMAKYPDRVQARAIANNCYPEAQDCIIKGCKELGERHHNNYEKPVDIIWLCKKHHNLLYHHIRKI